MRKFEKLSGKIKSKKELRVLELRLLQPKPIQKYKGPEIGRTNFAKRCIRLTFPTPKWVDRFGELFRVSTFGEYNTWDIEFLMELFSKLESGRLTWDKKRKCYYLKTRDGRKLKI